MEPSSSININQKPTRISRILDGDDMQIPRRLLALLLCSAIVIWAQGNSFDRVRYNGGSVDSKVDPKDWNNHLTVTSNMITLALKDGKKLEIPPKSVTSLSYGQEAHRRVGTMVALAILVAPVALFGLFYKTRLHYIGIQYKTPDNRTGGILLQGDKDDYRAILVALQGVTGATVAVGEKDREFVPVSVRTDVTKTEEEEKAAKEDKPTESAPAEPAKGTINISSNPSGADVLVDGEFVGNSPATLKLSPGRHTITVKISDYTDWSREITVQSQSIVQLTAKLEAEKQSDQSEQKTGVAVPLTPPTPPAPARDTGTGSPVAFGVVSLKSSPDGAEIYVDDSFVGKAPMTLKLKPGKHGFRMFMNHYHNWSQWIPVEAGSDVNITATLEKSD
jgi:hypothetical protein